MKEVTERLGALWNQLVPREGPAETVAGELTRAMNRIIYRWRNDGDRVGVGYGMETCNAAARYIIQKAEPIAPSVAQAVRDIWGDDSNDPDYEKHLMRAAKKVIAFIEKHYELWDVVNEEDMLNYKTEEDVAPPDDDADEFEHYGEEDID